MVCFILESKTEDINNFFKKYDDKYSVEFINNDNLIFNGI